MPDSYGEIFADMVDRQARYRERPDILRGIGMERHQFYNVTNPNRKTSGGHEYGFPTDVGVRATNEFKDYAWIKAVNQDCHCICITPEEAAELQDTDPQKALELFNKILGLVNGKKKGK